AGEGTRFDNDAPAVQAAIDSGTTTVFVPQGSYRILSPVRVRGNVRRVTGVGAGSQIGGGNNSSGIPYTNIIWLVTTGTYATVVIENMSCGSLQLCTGADNQSSRTLVLRHLFLQPPRFTGTGDIFVEDVCARYWEFNGQRVWARQINPEGEDTNALGVARLHLMQRGGSLWILGLKTEDWPTILDAADGAQTEILGGMIYSLDDARNSPMIRTSNSFCSIFAGEYLGYYGQPYATLVDETHGLERRTLLRGAPTYPATWSQNNDGTTVGSSGVVGSDFGLYVSKTMPEPTLLGVLALGGLLLRRRG
ncbi:MAG: hypothetical protein NTV22_12405, partial [bacterium]|nr:hypothetical protein [bacterium]